MKHAIAFLFLLTLTQAAEVVRLDNGAIVERLTLPAGIGAASVAMPGRLTPENVAAGWRDYAPATITGSVKAATWTDTGARWVESVTYYSAAELAQQAAELAQQAADAAEAQAKAAADQAKAAAEAQAKFAAEEDARIMALPSVAALKARLATNEAAVVKLSADVAAKVTPLK